MTTPDQLFLSYSRNDLEAAANLRQQLENSGLAVFKDDQDVREGDLWLNCLQKAVDECIGFVVLVGHDGVGRWIGAETQAALNRHFGPHDDKLRLPIFPILLGDGAPESLPAFLRLFQATRWNGHDTLSNTLIEQIRQRALLTNREALFEGCPFVGLDAYQANQAQLFFGRQKETLEALATFGTRSGSAAVRWLEINGNSGSGKSSLMNAGLLPLVDQGWLWPRTGYSQWRRIGPMMPGEHPVSMLAEQLGRAFKEEMADVRQRLEANDNGLAEWLRSRKQDETAFLLAIDQFEELFTFATPKELDRFDRLLAAALNDADCPLYLISTVRADFLDRFEEGLPRLVKQRSRLGKVWTPWPIDDDALREIIGGPARLAGLDVSEVLEAMVTEAHGEPGALPLVENALNWLWEQREGQRLSGLKFTQAGGLAGILSRGADDLLKNLGSEPARKRAMDLLFALVNLDPEGRRHTRRRLPRDEADQIAGGGEPGRSIVDRLAGVRSRDGNQTRGPLRLLTITEETTNGNGQQRKQRWVNLIHETLIRAKGQDDKGRPQPYWPTLWNYLETHKDRAARRERLRLQAREWRERQGLRRLFGLADWSDLLGFRGLAAPGSLEGRYLRWSTVVASLQALLLTAVLGVAGESGYWAKSHGMPLEAIATRWAYQLGRPLELPKLVPIPTGTFRMGSEAGGESERPVHPVTFADPFYLAATEISFAQYDAFCAATGCALPSDQGWPDRAQSPAINVDWNDARAYARWLDAMTGAGCRLPSEAEWEYAARASTTGAYALPAPGGSDDIQDKGLANCSGCGSEWSGMQTAPVGSFKPNDWGLYDMHGNVYEWVEDCWHKSYDGAPPGGKAWQQENGGDCSSRVLRGGSWYDDLVDARSAVRYSFPPSGRPHTFGFRVLCSSPIVEH